ncbi:MAG: hypothetical protein CMK89_09815 [Pseudomonadales bacterium]|nr:hypothetical protein [Pseudomonadales bacterium]
MSKQSETKPNNSDIGGKLLVALIGIFGKLPLWVLGKMGEWLGHAVWYLAPGARKVTLINLEMCFPAMDPVERLKLARQSICETTRTAFEIAAAWSQPSGKLLNLITYADNESILDDALAKNKGVVFIVPHFGNWELSNYYMAEKCDLLAMYKPAESPALDQLIYRARSQNTKMVAADKRGVIALFKALPQGKATGVLPDQEPTVKSGVWAPFFGVPALTPRLVSKLTNDTGSVAIGFGCQRNPDGKTFHVFFEPVEDDFYSEDIEVSAAAMNRCVERIILRDPKQYQWEYKRFKRRPNNEPRPYN